MGADTALVESLSQADLASARNRCRYMLMSVLEGSCAVGQCSWWKFESGPYQCVSEWITKNNWSTIAGVRHA